VLNSGCLQDVQETYSFFDTDDLDGEISALLEVPDIDYNLGGSSSRPTSFDMPGAYRGLQFGSMGSSGSGFGMGTRGPRRSLEILSGDCVVPDMAVPFQAAKRQRT
jgi:hypothetical protein